MKRILIILMILTLSILFAACGSSTDDSQSGDDITTNEETDDENVDDEDIEEEEDEIDEVEILVVEGGSYTDSSTGAITVEVPNGYVASEDTAYSSEETLATVTVKPQDAGSEMINTFLMIQIIATEEADASARAYLETYAKSDDSIEDVEVAGLKGYRFATNDMSGWLNEYYTLIGPKTIDGGFNYIVIVWGLGLDASYVDDVHGMITSLRFDFSQL